LDLLLLTEHQDAAATEPAGLAARHQDVSVGLADDDRMGIRRRRDVLDPLVGLGIQECDRGASRRVHWEWAGRYAILWIIGTVAIFGGISFVLDYLGADDGVRTSSLLLLATITIVNAIWRAVGALAARIELLLLTARNRADP
jgi:hypothetical protein